jgi:hypothetical protein
MRSVDVAPAAPSRFSSRLSQQILDLAVETAQLIVRPALKQAVQLLVNPQQKRLSLSQASTDFSSSRR